MSRFSRYNVGNDIASIYYYKGTETFKNKLGIKDPDILKEAESNIAFVKLYELTHDPIKGTFSKTHLLNVHKFLFGDIYYFAGKIRKEDISKGATKFCLSQFIESSLDSLLKELKEEKFLKGYGEEVFFERLAHYMAELNIIHPFREGNGRAIREFIRELVLNSGYTIYWSRVTEEEILDASIESVWNTQKLKECLIKCSEKRMSEITDYIIALTHLYGIVHIDKVLEIYNIQNEEKIKKIDMSSLIAGEAEELEKNFVDVFGEYFVHETIIDFDEFDIQMKAKEGKPFYVPDKEELLKYKDDNYHEETKEYNELIKYFAKKHFKGDENKARLLAEDIQSICQFDFDIGEIMGAISLRNISFASEKQANEMIQKVMKLANSTRIWENNGYTPDEIFRNFEKPNLNPLPDKKVGRNEECPCGSGKKYKKCCLNK